jgi:FkbM family methyltransferase
MEKLGTEYGGWFIPTNNTLNETSIIYSGGVGEDISFDLLISEKYNSNIFLIDPTKKSKKHYIESIQYFHNNIPFTGNIQNDYYYKIKNLKPNFDKIHYLELGLWSKNDTLKFYKQNNPNYVSQSVINGMFGDNYDIIQVDSIKNIMDNNKHKHIDLLKLDIEGAEIETLNEMLNNNIYPTIICVEFDLKLKNKDSNNVTDKLIDRLINQHNYNILINDNLNVTFVKK